MQDSPTQLELVEAVESFIRDRAMPELEGHTNFHARVAANVLGILKRELDQGPNADAKEKARLVELLGRQGTLEELNKALCQGIRDGSLSLETGGMKEHLIETTIQKVEIDQPKYSGLSVAKEKWR